MIVFDGNMKGCQHKSFNELVVRSVCKNNKEIMLVVNKSLDLKNPEVINLRRKTIPVISPGGLNNFFKPIVEFCSLFYAAYLSQYYKDKEVLILSLSPVMTYLVIYIARFFKTTNFKFFYHGELEYIKSKKKTINKPGFWVNKSLLSSFPDNLSRIVLGDHINNRLKEIYPEVKVFSLEHPVSFNDTFEFELRRSKEKFLLGVVGELTKPCIRENIEKILNIAVQDNFSTKCKFVFVGRIDINLEELFDRFQGYSSLSFSGVSKKFIPEDVYSNYLDEVDYFIVLYPEGEYDLTASGIFSEMVSRNKKFISLGNSYFKNIHSMCPGAGVIIDELEDINNLVGNLKSCLEKSDTEILKKYYSWEIFSKKLQDLF